MARTHKTAICMNKDGNPVPVICKLWTNWHGAPNLQKTKARLAKDHPDLKFHGWAYDLADDEDRTSLRCAFLSPQIVFTFAWIMVHDEISFIPVTREMVAA